MSCFAKAIYLALLFATAFGTNHLSLEDLREALNTSEKIWDVIRSEDTQGFNGKITCVYDEKVNQTGDKYVFRHGYKDGEKQASMILYAEIKQEGEEDPFLLITKEPGTPARHNRRLTRLETASEGKDVAGARFTHAPQDDYKHTLRHWNPDEHCFILTFTNKTTGETRCHLHIWQQEVQGHMPEYGFPCEKDFDNICKDKYKYLTYSEQCQRGT